MKIIFSSLQNAKTENNQTNSRQERKTDKLNDYISRRAYKMWREKLQNKYERVTNNHNAQLISHCIDDTSRVPTFFSEPRNSNCEKCTKYTRGQTAEGFVDKNREKQTGDCEKVIF